MLPQTDINRLIRDLLITILLVSSGSLRDALAQSEDDRISSHLKYLAADARMGRGLGTAGLDSAAHYIARQFQAAGLEPGGTDGYFQPFRIDPTAPAVAHAGIGETWVKNVVGILPGRGRLAGQAVVIGAHYDHLGLGGMGSLDPDSTDVVHNGADDNASGTSALLSAAAILAHQSTVERRTLVFVAFTAEELGLIGSSHYVKNPTVSNDSTYAMVNMDMVGRLREGSLITIGTGSAEELTVLLDSVNTRFGLTLKDMEDPWGRSDHSSFYGEGIPVVHLFTDNHEDYHRTTDDWGKINVEGVATVARFAADLAWTFSTRSDPLTFVDVPQPVQASTGGYGAYLGTIPDMSGSPGGVRFTGVRSGSPAEKAGLQGGDILVQFGEMEIKDLYDMTAALREHKPGDVVPLAVMRDGERIELTATLGRRGG
jgi:hypothetical protein